MVLFCALHILSSCPLFSLRSSNISVDMTVDSQISYRTKLMVSGLSNDDMALLYRRSDSKLDQLKLDVHGGQAAQQTIRVFNVLCVAPILQFASQGKLLSALKPGAPWTTLAPPDASVPFGCCERTNPPRPTEHWHFDDERKAWDRRSEPGASRKYFLALQAAPKPFEFWVDKVAGSLTVKMYPEVSAHHAAHQLINGRGGHSLEDQVEVYYRLSDVSQQKDPEIRAFKVLNCDGEKPTSVNLKAPHQLYERQQKVVSKMLDIENAKTPFEELELSEHEMPGALGLSLVARASRSRKISGGVICDAIGSGKTVISIAIILSGLDEARRRRSNKNRLPNQTGATLVIVPPALIDQWESELKKFTDGLKVVKIYGNSSLSKCTLQKIMDADVVICPVDILESNEKGGYVQRVLKAAGDKVSDVPTLPSYSGQIEQSGARGTWIPATSADPYGGANNGNNQKVRCVVAQVTSCPAAFLSVSFW